MEISKAGDTGSRRVRVWDIATRAIHWAFVLLIPFLWWSERHGRLDWHIKAGIAVAALLVLRLFLGFFGAETSRFSEFVRGPRAAWGYIRSPAKRIVGHNPLGGWSVVAMLVLLIAETGLGLVSSDEDGLDSGPFANYLSFDQARLASYLHGLLFQAIAAFVCLHVAAVLFYLTRGQNLLGPMLTGFKRLPPEIAAPKLASPLIVVGGLVLAAAIFAILWRLDGL